MMTDTHQACVETREADASARPRDEQSAPRRKAFQPPALRAHGVVELVTGGSIAGAGRFDGGF